MINTNKYHVFAPMGRLQLKSIYLYFPAGTTVENKGKLILTKYYSDYHCTIIVNNVSHYNIVKLSFKYTAKQARRFKFIG